jgi:DNA polymerase V
MNITCNNVKPIKNRQLDLYNEIKDDTTKQERLQKAVIDIKKEFGKNSVFKGVSLKTEATGLERNKQIGGHKSGEEA